MNHLLYGTDKEYDVAFPCPVCNGEPLKYWAYNLQRDCSVEVTERAYKLLPKTEEEALKKGQHYCQYEVEQCEHCNGTGEVIYSIDELREAEKEFC